MTSISQGLAFTTAMVLSSTVLYLAFHWHNTTAPFQIHDHTNSHHSNNKALRPCLYSIQEKKREGNMKRKKKRVQFADNVIELRKESEEMKKEQRKQNRGPSKCRHNKTSENHRIPANRIILYKGILRDKVKVFRIASSY